MANLTNKNTTKGIVFRVLDDTQCEKIYTLTCELLAKKGWTLGNDTHGRAKEYLAKAGCDVKDETVFVPTEVIESALKSAPSTVTIYDQHGEPAMIMDYQNPKSYLMTAANPPLITDYSTGERRQATCQDAYQNSLVQAALPNIDLPCGMTWLSDCPQSLIGTYEVREMIRAHWKPVAVLAHDSVDYGYLMEECYAVAGSREQFIEKPFAVSIGTLNTADDTISVIESGAVLIAQSCPLVGAKAPVTILGTLVQGLAENLVTLVLSQQIRPGYPYVGSIYADILDFRSISYTQTAPEMPLASAASADLFRYLHLPCSCHLGGTDSPVFDQQAAFDIAAQLMIASFSGVGISGFSGLLESAVSASLLNIVYADEIKGYINHLTQGISTVDDEDLSQEEFMDIGFNGNFMMEEQTAMHMSEYWAPQLFTRDTFEQWKEKGAKTYEQRAKEKIDDIIAAGCMEPKSDELMAKIDAIVEKATKSRA